MASDTRALVIEALTQQNGLRKEQITDYVVGMNSAISAANVGRTLASLLEGGSVHLRHDCYYINRSDVVQRNGEHDRVELPPYLAQRPGQLVTIEQSPTELEGVVRLQFQQGEHWFTYPVAGELRICIGPDIPRWSAMQETNEGICAIRIVFRDGTAREITVKRGTPITIAPKE